MEEKITIEYTLEQKDFVNFNISRRMQNVATYIIFALFFAVIVFQIVNAANIFVVGLYILIFAIYMIFPYISAKKIFDSMPPSYKSLKVCLDKEEFTISDVKTSYTKKWGEVLLCKEYSKFFAIFVSNSAATIIPKRVLSEIQKKEISSLFETFEKNKK